MSTLAATFTLANTATLRQTLKDLNFLLAETGNPDVTAPAVTITADSAGTLTFAVAASQSNPAYSKAVSATVA